MNRAIACRLKYFILFNLNVFYLAYELNRFDAAIQDCFEVLSIDSKYING